MGNNLLNNQEDNQVCILFQGCIKFLIPGGGVGLSSLLGVNYRILSCEEGKGIIHGCGGRKSRGKKERGSNNHLPYNMKVRLFGRISSGEIDRDENFGQENQDFKKWGWGREKYKVNYIQCIKYNQGVYYTPQLYFILCLVPSMFLLMIIAESDCF